MNTNKSAQFESQHIEIKIGQSVNFVYDMIIGHILSLTEVSGITDHDQFKQFR